MPFSSQASSASVRLCCGAGMQKSMIIVVPPASAAAVPERKSSHATVPMKGISMWVCGSMPPGRTKAPPASTTSAPAGASQALAHGLDDAAVAQHIGAELAVGVDDGAAADQQGHGRGPPGLCWRGTISGGGALSSGAAELSAGCEA